MTEKTLFVVLFVRGNKLADSHYIEPCKHVSIIKKQSSTNAMKSAKKKTRLPVSTKGKRAHSDEILSKMKPLQLWELTG